MVKNLKRNSNQISQIVEESIKDTDKVLPIPSEQIPSALLMPTVTGVRSLDIETMHAYAIQLTYSDGCVKNYYLHNIDTADIPETVVVDGFEFDSQVYKSLSAIALEITGRKISDKEFFGV